MPQPIYQRIAEDLRQQIESGALPRGSQLPSEMELRDRYSASRNTVRDALKRLTVEGLLETRPGHGTFVTRAIDPFVSVLTADAGHVGTGEGATYLSEVSAGHRLAMMSIPRVEVQAAAPVVAARLRVAPGTQVVSRHQQRYIDAELWSLQTTFYPLEFTERGARRLLIAADIEGGAVRYLADTLGIRQTGYRDWITVRGASAVEQSSFRVSHDATVFEIFRTAFDQHQKPTRVTVTVFPGDRNQFIVNVGDVPGPRYDEDVADPA